MTTEGIAEREEARAWFQKHCPRGTTIYTILRHMSSSGMTRHIGLVVIKGEDVIFHPNYSAGKLLKMRLAKNDDGLVVSGCGMDMGFHVVYNLGHAVHGDGYAFNHRWL